VCVYVTVWEGWGGYLSAEADEREKEGEGGGGCKRLKEEKHKT